MLSRLPIEGNLLFDDRLPDIWWNSAGVTGGNGRMAAQKPRTIFLLRLLQLNIYNLMIERLRPAGLTPIQYLVLSILSRRGTWSTAELARRFHIAPQSMTEIVASLQKKKLIAR